MKISVIIPAYNEEKVIGKSISKIISFLENKKFNYEIIVIDDCSKDRTSNIVKDFNSKKIILIRNKKNMGKGYSVKRGVMNAIGDLVLFSDADLSTPISELTKFLPLSHEYDVVIGSRVLKESVVLKQKFYRELVGTAFNLLVQLLLIRGIRDTQCGFKLFRKNVAKDIFKKQRIGGFCFDAEILYLAKNAGYKIKEVPIKWINAESSKVNPVTDSIKMFIDLVRIRLRY